MGATASNEKFKGSRRKNGLSDHTGAWQGFVDIPLSDEQRATLAAFGPEDYPDVGAFLEDVLADGYKVSITRDEKHSCTIATLTGKGEGCVNAGFSLSARGPDMAGALLVLHFKHVMICDKLRWDGQAAAKTTQLSMWG